MSLFNGLLMACAVAAAFVPIRSLPDRRPLPETHVGLTYLPVAVAPAAGPLKLAGAWEMSAKDRRFGGLSSLTLAKGRFLAVSDLGAVVRFDLPTTISPFADIKDLREGPGLFRAKWTRDAESIAPDPAGRGIWVGYEQRHSLWLYDPTFTRAISSVSLGGQHWPDNRGAEAVIADGTDLLVLAENGRDALRVGPSGIERLPLNSGAGVADAARAPDGSIWLLLRSGGWNGIEQSIAPLVRTNGGYAVGKGFQVPKAMTDNLEGLAIQRLQTGGWRFWLVSDNGRQGMVRNLLVALDYMQPSRHDKSPATGAGPSK